MVEKGTDYTAEKNKRTQTETSREREITTNSGKDANCNTSKARGNMQQPLKEKISVRGRSIVISRQRPTLGTKFTN
jgi:hypothetical protein